MPPNSGWLIPEASVFIDTAMRTSRRVCEDVYSVFSMCYGTCHCEWAERRRKEGLDFVMGWIRSRNVTVVCLIKAICRVTGKQSAYLQYGCL